MSPRADFGPYEQIETYLRDKEYYSASSLERFQRCRRKFFYEREYGIASFTPSPAADAGNVLHAGLAELYRTYNVESGLAALQKEYARLFSWITHSPERLENRFLLANLEDIYLAYIEYWKDQPLRVEPTMVEVGTIVTIKDFMYITRQDLIATLPRSGQIYPVDHKSGKNLPREEQFNPDNQTTSYIYSLRRIVAEEAAMRVTINAIQVGVRERKFARLEIGRCQQDLDEWEDEAIQIVGEIRRARDKDMWFKNTSECTSYGLCPFRECCNTFQNQSVLNNYPRREIGNPFHF